MRIVIRADASLFIGTGHIMRCLTLAEQLIARQHEVIFICRDHYGNMIDFIRNKGYQVFVLYGVDHNENREEVYLNWLGADWYTDAQQTIDYLKQLNSVDWVIVDHYAIDWRWEEQVLSYMESTQIFVIDDLANRRHTCHILLDQNLSMNLLTRYRKLLPDSTTTYLGPSYALLRDEFIYSRKTVKIRNGNIKNITVFYGGIDLTGETLKAIRALKELSLEQISIKIIVGPNNPQRLKIKEICRQLSNYIIEDHVSNMAELMKQTDLFIGAGGSTTWERCMLGVPSITTVVADNQKEITEAVEHYGATWNLGEHWKVAETTIIQAVRYAVTHPLEVHIMSKRCLDVIGDYQGSSVVIDKIASLIKGKNG
ncbi:UDP-2,4-diacetamido-2,4,6-trideoxy-beta-L-altropyranose hydrolase [Paenibacillus ferrarius]|uniref:UDP-2,4-diacetamido-2,4, 6-trideoxy-beta-L-altropyranose hydrolase n=1 Tax=Paenibacillus ferrarius TaxID=1469647 RepID=A0A1V4HFZ7_9BACL|nr:UDP-2,4-diacetamido-2,4,6-trideoxy-beta-L-altropyranose hydrolase [Paenibacillus ferrarius]OPH54551.1 UDP-2,4-diacetamido-2,4,6-trideoxy-beta-L-altropyranose hydrolase [Paenibacillus ferrarius]